MLPPLVVVPERRKGRGDRVANGEIPAADVHLKVDPDDYDRLEAIAKRNREKLGPTIRRALKKFIADELLNGNLGT